MRYLSILLLLIGISVANAAVIDSRFISGAFDSLLATKDTDDLTVGSTNLYFTDTLARGAVSAAGPITYNSGTGEFGCSVASVSVAGCVSSASFTTFTNGLVTPYKAALTLVSDDITAQYRDMAVECKANSMNLIVKGAGAVPETLDYTLSVVSDVTRITFAGDLATAGATPLVAGDVLYVKCLE